jgi:hypothetical protein
MRMKTNLLQKYLNRDLNVMKPCYFAKKSLKKE